MEGVDKSARNVRKIMFLDGVKAAVRQGYTQMANGGSAVDAVEAAITSMEDNTLYNAGNEELFSSSVSKFL